MAIAFEMDPNNYFWKLIDGRNLDADAVEKRLVMYGVQVRNTGANMV